jgi:hypothetical protein
MRSQLILVGAGIKEPSDADDVIWTRLLYRGGVFQARLVARCAVWGRGVKTRAGATAGGDGSRDGTMVWALAAALMMGSPDCSTATPEQCRCPFLVAARW